MDDVLMFNKINDQQHHIDNLIDQNIIDEKQDILSNSEILDE